MPIKVALGWSGGRQIPGALCLANLAESMSSRFGERSVSKSKVESSGEGFLTSTSGSTCTDTHVHTSIHISNTHTHTEFFSMGLRR